MQLLIDAGADVNSADSDGITPLIVAAQSGHQQSVQLLIDEGADVNKTDTGMESYHCTLLQKADVGKQCSCSSKRVLTSRKQTQVDPRHCSLLHTAGIGKRCSCSSKQVVLVAHSSPVQVGDLALSSCLRAESTVDFTRTDQS